jgi:Ribonuclease G/E
MLIDATHPEETRVVVVSGTKLEELDFEVASRKPIKGNIYLAKVTRVEPSLQAAFVEYGGNRHGFLAFSEIHPDYYRIPVSDREALEIDAHRVSAPAYGGGTTATARTTRASTPSRRAVPTTPCSTAATGTTLATRIRAARPRRPPRRRGPWSRRAARTRARRPTGSSRWAATRWTRSASAGRARCGTTRSRR